ncbi:transposase [Candidatus Uabimicrobium amorphum]|uniref:Transposase n=1 Tax=Uabimicrobium amorphum TaxID=2596890 RepID=A0A5S9ITE7_UABAM|nr:transposase [Candidatus Uabimicrobium amorphum]
MILLGAKMSLSNKIRTFFKKIKALDKIISPGGLHQARNKLDPKLYKHLQNTILKTFYEEAKDENKKWKNNQIYAVDVSTINLPKSEETLAFFSVQSNQSPTERVQGYGSFLYDVLNELPINQELEAKQSEIKFVFDSHCDYYDENTIVLYDRAYASNALVALHKSLSVPCVIRCSTSSSFSIVSEFLKSDSFDSVYKLVIPKEKRIEWKKYNLPSSVNVRLIKVILSTGEVEVLLTTLLDQELYPLDDFAWLYHQRWKIETYFDRLKNQLDVERFSSGFLLHIEQDFYARVFMSALESIVIKSEQQILDQECDKKNTKYRYRINKSISYAELHDEVIALLYDESIPIEEAYAEIRVLFRLSPSPIRPDNNAPRVKKSASYQLWHQKYRKKTGH